MKNTYKRLFSIISVFLFSSLLISLSACDKNEGGVIDGSSDTEINSESESEENTETETEIDPDTESGDSTDDDSDIPVHITLETPVLNLDNDTGLIQWNEINEAEYYRYYINAGEIKQTSETSLVVQSGSTISVIAESTKENVSASEWSKPVTYFENLSAENVTIAFANCHMQSVAIQKGTSYTPSAPENKHYHTFEGWYLDPFYTQKLSESHIFEENTILYANYLKDNWANNATYWLWASPMITSATMSSLDGWNFIPLNTLDENKSSEKNANVFSVVVTVNGASETTPAAFIAVDGAVGDHPGRIYFKNGDQDFTIKQDGTYKIYFSSQYYWINGDVKVNCHIEYLDSSSTNSIYNEFNMPTSLLTNSKILKTPVLFLGDDKQTVVWSPIANATEYQYVIDNGDVKTTTSNSVNLPQGSHITVRAITNASEFLSSKWSMPYYREIPVGNDFVYVYFYGANKPSEKIAKGSTISRPNNNPTKFGYQFDDWYTSITHSSKFDFTKPIEKNTTIYASFTMINSIKYSLYESNKTSKIGDFEMYPNYDFNEYKIIFENNTINKTIYVKDNDTGEFYGSYTVEYTGSVKIYFSPDHLWDIGTENERNVYIAPNTRTIYFTNNKDFDSVYYYTWESNKQHETGWPGALMTYVETNDYGQEIYSFTTSTSYTMVIFSDGTNNNQTIDIDLENEYSQFNAFYLTNKVSGKWEVAGWNK